MEEWRPVVGYENYYEISSLGRLRSKKTGRYLKIHTKTRKDGYYYNNLHKHGTKKPFLIHRLVAQAFLPNPENKYYVNHIDGNKLNNAASNLEWVTAKENEDHAYRIGIKNQTGEKNPTAKLTESDVIRIRQLAEEGVHYKEIAKMYNIHTSYANGLILRRTWKHI